MASISLSLMSLKSQSLLPHPLYLFIKGGHLFVAPARFGFCIRLAQLVERFFHREFLGHGVRGAPQLHCPAPSALGSVIPAGSVCKGTARRARVTVRCGAFSPGAKHLTPQASIATRATLRDDRETSLMAARAGREHSSDLRNYQERSLDLANGPPRRRTGLKSLAKIRSRPLCFAEFRLYARPRRSG